MVAYRDEADQPVEAIIRIALKELVAQLDPGQFAQVHRSAVVNPRAISLVRRPDNDTAELHFYSGTVGAAREATFFGVPAIAVSVAARAELDIFAVRSGLISVTPLETDTTNHCVIASLREWERELPPGL